MELSDGVGWSWNADVAGAVGWEAVAGAVGVVAGGVVRGADGVVDLAGAVGAACRAGLRRGACTVTCGSGLLLGAADGGAGVVSGVGVVCGTCGPGVSDAGGVMTGGVSDGVAGVCDHAAPAKQSAISAELLRKSERLLRIDIIRPLAFPTGTTVGPEHQRSTAKAPCGGIGAAFAGARPADTRSDVRRWEARGRRGVNDNAVAVDQIRPPLRTGLARTPRAVTRRVPWPAARHRRDE
jgi:hypothetical protein